MKRNNYFQSINPRINFPQMEEEVLKYWDKENIFEKSIQKNKGKKNFVFYEGPPTANGKPGVHHVEARVFKDLYPRYKTMQGFYCERKAGWDTHGLPVELEIEKKLGISGKKQIEKFGIQKFCDLCRESVFKYVKQWQEMTKRIGFWVDMDNAYVTYANEYIESEWSILKKAYDKKRLYKDYKVVPYCPRCETPLSSHELALGYKDNIKDPSVYVKFALKGRKNTYLLVWTTTPWTLPGNVALAVDPKATYIEVRIESETYILAEKRKAILGKNFKVVRKIKGESLVNLEYEPLFAFVEYEKKAHYIIPADFVSLDEGTGIVHTAVMYGEDDFEIGKKYNLPRKHVVDIRGNFIDKVKPWAGTFVKNADEGIIKDLDKRNLLYKREDIYHTYPFCWRCQTPLLYYALTSWYLKTTSVKKILIDENNKVNWIPKHIRKGRMGEWLENNRDWALSRTRYWGTPLPIWVCDKCEKETTVGSIEELSKLAVKELDLKTLDLHRPKIDEVVLRCPSCNGLAHRLPFVIDCWFDSGAMPFAQWHYPFENKKIFKESFPADFIAEAIDQTRGWFYTLQAVSIIIDMGGVYKNAICLGHVLDEEGNKMSKSKGNVVDPWEVINKAGVDAMRWYFYSVISPGESFRFSLNLVNDVNRRFLLTLWNVFNYFITYSRLDKISRNDLDDEIILKGNYKALDLWILSRLAELVNNTTDYLNKFNTFNSSKCIEDFVADLSTWYIRRSRDRTGFSSSNEKDKKQFYSVMYFVLTTLTKIMAPFTPFISEYIYKNLDGRKSIHLADWPKEGDLKKYFDKDLLSDMIYAREIVELIHSQRKSLAIPIRQPLSSVTIIYKDTKLADEVEAILLEEVNIKKAVWKKGKTLNVSLDTKITPKLEEEANTRALIRRIQNRRKEMSIDLLQKVDVKNDWLPKEKELSDKVKKLTLARSLTLGDFEVKKSSK